mmetsp:Transcript_26356/g.55037  ORF Transcript_26356/g.55037 Transcript_26356/m.55037 type:complete len:375 (-) Transcript_26356:235-1359(-)
MMIDITIPFVSVPLPTTNIPSSGIIVPRFILCLYMLLLVFWRRRRELRTWRRLLLQLDLLAVGGGRSVGDYGGRPRIGCFAFIVGCFPFGRGRRVLVLLASVFGFGGLLLLLHLLRAFGRDVFFRGRFDFGGRLGLFLLHGRFFPVVHRLLLRLFIGRGIDGLRSCIANGTIFLRIRLLLCRTLVASFLLRPFYIRRIPLRRRHGSILIQHFLLHLHRRLLELRHLLLLRLRILLRSAHARGIIVHHLRTFPALPTISTVPCLLLHRDLVVVIHRHLPADLLQPSILDPHLAHDAFEVSVPPPQFAELAQHALSSHSGLVIPRHQSHGAPGVNLIVTGVILSLDAIFGIERLDVRIEEGDEIRHGCLRQRGEFR